MKLPSTNLDSVGISGHEWSTTQRNQISEKQDEHNIYEVMKRKCPPGYHHNGFVATHALGHMTYAWGHCLYAFSWLNISIDSFIGMLETKLIVF